MGNSRDRPGKTRTFYKASGTLIKGECHLHIKIQDNTLHVLTVGAAFLQLMSGWVQSFDAAMSLTLLHTFLIAETEQIFGTYR